jgi:glycerol-3-phosphate dehydrogenase
VRYPERLVLENVRDAVDHGAVLETYTRVTRLRVENGRAIGVDWESARGLGGARAPLIVNAAGPWSTRCRPIRHI